MTETPYDIYVRFYGMVQSGTKLTKDDYLGIDESGDLVEFNESKRIAASLAVQDVSSKRHMRSKGDFSQELADLQK